MNKCPYGLKRFHALKKELRIFLTTIFQVPGMDLPEPREVADSNRSIPPRNCSKLIQNLPQHNQLSADFDPKFL